ncbi:MAG: DUF3772 domain-containing protein, partial [Acidovorax sp.]|uniref:DUF3772 domain-containing protein n=1 Tax=Acidovorax sp. TaxID=1872122 RepID=UPI0039E669D8
MRATLPLPPAARRALACWAAAFFLCLALPAQAVPASGDGPPATSTEAALPSVDELRRQLDAIATKPGEDDDRRQLLADVNAIGKAAEQLTARRTEELADIDSRLAGLGPAPEKGATPDAPDVAELRASLGKQRAAIDAELKLARLIAVDATQRATELVRQWREQFRTALTTRTDSPLSDSFWRALRTAAPGDLARLRALAGELRVALAA